MSICVASPFKIFPEELWLLIIKSSIQTSVQSLFHVFPRFFKTFKNITNFMEFRRESSTHFKCRPSFLHVDYDKLVTNEWIDAVESFVETQTLEPDTPSEFRYAPTYIENILPVHFISVKNILSFRQPWHSIEISKIDQSSSIPFLTACADYLVKHGNSIRFAVIDLYGQEYRNVHEASQVFGLAIKCLTGLRNVEKLSIRFGDVANSNFVEKCVNFAHQTQKYPNLPQLNLLEVRDVETQTGLIKWRGLLNPEDNVTLQYFFNGYISKGKVKTLRFLRNEKDFQFEEEYQLDKISHQYTNLRDFVTYIKYQNMKRITIKPMYNVFIICLMWWFVKQQFNAREVIIEKIDRWNALSVWYEPIPLLTFVRYLKITDSIGLEYRFLTGMPSLERLHILCDQSERKKMLTYRPSEDRLTKTVRKYLYQDEACEDGDDIWTVLPQLKSFVVQGGGIICKQFVRSLKNKPLLFTQ